MCISPSLCNDETALWQSELVLCVLCFGGLKKSTYLVFESKKRQSLKSYYDFFSQQTIQTQRTRLPPSPSLQCVTSFFLTYSLSRHVTVSGGAGRTMAPIRSTPSKHWKDYQAVKRLANVKPNAFSSPSRKWMSDFRPLMCTNVRSGDAAQVLRSLQTAPTPIWKGSTLVELWPKITSMVLQCLSTGLERGTAAM